MLRTKFFAENNVWELEDSVNTWIERNSILDDEIINIKYEYSEFRKEYTVMILYSIGAETPMDKFIKGLRQFESDIIKREEQ